MQEEMAYISALVDKAATALALVVLCAGAAVQLASD
jgi:hypothetical protein